MVSNKEKIADKIFIAYRILIVLAITTLFVPVINPARISGMISKNQSIFSTGTSYANLTSNFARAFRKGWVGEGTLQMVYAGSILICIGIVLYGVAGCFSVGSRKLKRKSALFGILGSVVLLGGALVIHFAAMDIKGTSKPEKIEPMYPAGLIYFIIGAVLFVIISVILFMFIPKPGEDEKAEIESKYKLFLMLLPFIIMCFVFSYLPLFGWRFAFFDYRAGDQLSMDSFVGFKWFTYLFEKESVRRDLVTVMKNTLAMSGLGLATSWCAMAFAIFLNEIKQLRVRRFIQVFTTIPNFISWVLVYAVAFAIFSTDGFISSILLKWGVIDSGINFLMSSSHTWLKMLAWGMWKGLGWSAIIYIAAISGIDQQLYEAASVDGAGRFRKMWNITVPCLIPTFMVLLIMSIANVLSNGMDQYFVFENANNTNAIKVLDLYVYKLGISRGSVPLATVIGMAKSLISVALLFIANSASKLIRGESIL